MIAFAAVCALGVMTAIIRHSTSVQSPAIPAAPPARRAAPSGPDVRPDHVVIVMMENKNEGEPLRRYVRARIA